jgi:hypothetical protein
MPTSLPRPILARLPVVVICLLAAVGPSRSQESGLQFRSRTFDHSALEEVLAACVRGEGVDYPLVRERFLPQLEAYLARVTVEDVGSLPPQEQLALYINAYNVTVLREVARRYEPGYSVSRDEFKLFDERLLGLGRQLVSLNQLEHEIIRRRFDEPRIHAALVCGARSCPPLLPRPYRAEDLEETLEGNMRRFVNDAARNQIKKRRLVLSKIFEWYADDFGGLDSLAAYVDRYTDADVSGSKVAFQDYSWELNLAAEPSEKKPD